MNEIMQVECQMSNKITNNKNEIEFMKEKKK